jgi:hypothetical protein
MIQKLIKQCETRLNYLKIYRNSNIELGNDEIVNKVDTEILEIEETIEKLKTI